MESKEHSIWHALLNNTLNISIHATFDMCLCAAYRALCSCSESLCYSRGDIRQVASTARNIAPNHYFLIESCCREADANCAIIAHKHALLTFTINDSQAFRGKLQSNCYNYWSARAIKDSQGFLREADGRLQIERLANWSNTRMPW